jgi:hypothetical protein
LPRKPLAAPPLGSNQPAQILIKALVLKDFFDPNDARANFGQRKQFQNSIGGPATPLPKRRRFPPSWKEGRVDKFAKKIGMRFGQMPRHFFPDNPFFPFSTFSLDYTSFSTFCDTGVT